MKYLCKALCSVFALLLSSSAFADSHIKKRPNFGPPDGWSVGLGISASNGIYIGEESSTRALPLLRYESKALSINLPRGLRATVWEKEDLRISGLLSPRISEIGSSDASELAGLDRKEITIDGGLQLNFKFGIASELKASVVKELTSEHSGVEAQLGLQQVLPLGHQLPLFINAGFKWQSEDLASFLYGVDPDEATATRAAYSPGDVLFPYLSLRTAYRVTDQVVVVAQVSTDFLPSEVTDSSIIDNDLDWGALLAVSYHF